MKVALASLPRNCYSVRIIRLKLHRASAAIKILPINKSLFLRTPPFQRNSKLRLKNLHNSCPAADWYASLVGTPSKGLPANVAPVCQPCFSAFCASIRIYFSWSNPDRGYCHSPCNFAPTTNLHDQIEDCCQNTHTTPIEISIFFQFFPLLSDIRGWFDKLD